MIIIDIIKKYLNKYPKFKIHLKDLYNWIKPICGKNNKFLIQGVNLKKRYSIKGNNNLIQIGKGSVIRNTEYHVWGNNNKIIIGSNCRVSQWGSLWIDGDNNIIIIRDGTSIQSGHICAQGVCSKIDIGEYCMLSNTIQIRTSDSHPIYDKNTQELINPDGNVIIEPNVWIAAQATIMKNVRIGSGSIVGFGSIVTKNIPKNSMAVGVPAKVVKSDIMWKRTKDTNLHDK